MYVDGMDDLANTRENLNRQLDEAIAADALAALTEIVAVQRDIATRRQEAVRSAVSNHTWAEIGEALGVSRQAAHRKFAKWATPKQEVTAVAKEWANTLRDEIEAEHKAMKTAIREGDHARAAAAEAKRDALIAEVTNAGRRGKK
jgi:hypothetical protein